MGTLFPIYEHFRDFVKCIFTILLQIQHENNFLPTRNHRQKWNILRNHVQYKYIHMRITNNEDTIRIKNWQEFTKQNMTKNV